MSAASGGHNAVVKTLLERGAAVNHAKTVGFVVARFARSIAASCITFCTPLAACSLLVVFGVCALICDLPFGLVMCRTAGRH